MDRRRRIHDGVALAVWAEARALATAGRLASHDALELRPGPVARALAAGEPGPEANLVTALTLDGVDPRRVFDDRLADGPGLALAGALLASAADADTEASSWHVHFWVSETARGWLDDWEPPQVALRGDLHDMLALGINLRGRAIEPFLWAARRGLRARETNTGFLGAVACLTWAASRLEPALRATSALDEHAARASFMAGLLAGAWGGFTRDEDLEMMNLAVRETTAFAYDVGAVGSVILGRGEA